MGKKRATKDLQKLLEYEGFISLEEIDPKSLIEFDSKEKKNRPSSSPIDVRKHSKTKSVDSRPKATSANTHRFIERDMKVPKKSPRSKTKPPQKREKPSVLDCSGMQDWHAYGLHKKILSGLKRLNFDSPTPIQEKVLSEAIGNKRDILGTAQTGSGKTLAYALPILNHLANGWNRKVQKDVDSICALVLVPTRELGIQIAKHIKDAAVFLPPASTKIVSLIGGLSVEKQERESSNYPDVIIATPGRLWELMDSSSASLELKRGLRNLEFLVIDEADRMVESGHFKELDLILEMIFSSSSLSAIPQDIDTDATIDDAIHDFGTTRSASKYHQTFVFSATLSLSAPQRGKKSKAALSAIDKLLAKLSFRREPFIIDLSTHTTLDSPFSSLIPLTLSQYKILCPKEEKDYFLCYFLFLIGGIVADNGNAVGSEYSGSGGKTIVFVNSIDTIRRIVPLLENLKIPNVFSLHAQMQQRQRLKNIDCFKGKADESAVLVCSDVAARGLDIPTVTHVVHYQLPRTPNIYIHRSGRTARANRSGIALSLVSEDEFLQYKRLLIHLGSRREFPTFTAELSLLGKMKPLVNLAKKVDELEHRLNKDKFDNNWLKETAQIFDIEVEDEMIKDISDEKKIRSQVRQLKANLSSQIDAFTRLYNQTNGRIQVK